MRNNKTVWILALVLLLAIGGAYLLYNKLAASNQAQQLTQTPAAPQSEPEKAPGTAAEETTEERVPLAPDFTVYDHKGEEVQLSSFRGKPVVLNFWSSSCGPCKMEMPDFQKAYEKYGEDLHFVMVNMTDGVWDTQVTASAYVEEQGFQFPVYFDLDIDAAAAYGVRSLPITYFLDQEGRGVAYGQGALDAQTLQKGIDLLLSPEAAAE